MGASVAEQDLKDGGQAAEYDVRLARPKSTAFFFNSAAQPLFGLYGPPAAHQDLDCGVLLCGPVGHEYDRAHWELRLLGDHLIEAGFHVMRFMHVEAAAGVLERLRRRAGDLFRVGERLGCAREHVPGDRTLGQHEECGADRGRLLEPRETGGEIPLRLHQLRLDLRHRDAHAPDSTTVQDFVLKPHNCATSVPTWCPNVDS